jgi:hypothetical protein
MHTLIYGLMYGIRGFNGFKGSPLLCNLAFIGNSEMSEKTRNEWGTYISVSNSRSPFNPHRVGTEPRGLLIWMSLLSFYM